MMSKEGKFNEFMSNSFLSEEPEEEIKVEFQSPVIEEKKLSTKKVTIEPILEKRK